MRRTNRQRRVDASPRKERPMRTSIATVCLSGGLDDKLAAAAAAGFDGVEIFENDLIACASTPTEIRRRIEDLGLSMELYQPFRDFEAVPPDRLAHNLRRARRKLELACVLGAPMLLVCSSVSELAIDDDDLASEQLHQLATLGAEYGVRVAYEALSWGRHVNDYEHAWRIVEAAGHPALGVCLDTFHILSRGTDLDGIGSIPADKLFFLQLADAPNLAMDVLQWSRHHRCFPGQGSFDLPGFLQRAVAAGYRGPLSLEVFNDVFRQADPGPTAVDAMRSLRGLQEALGRLCGTTSTPGVDLARLPRAIEPSGFAFVELAVDASSGPMTEDLLGRLGLAHGGQHRSKPVQLWQRDDARVLLNYGDQRLSATLEGDSLVTALGIESADPAQSARRADALMAPRLPRRRGPAEADLVSVAAPGDTAVFFCRTQTTPSWLDDFLPLATADRLDGGDLTAIDHVGLIQPFEQFQASGLFYQLLLGLQPRGSVEYAAPTGLMRSRALASAGGRIRLALNVPALGGDLSGPATAQHVAFGCRDIFATAAAMRERALPILPLPTNYYEDLDARWELDPALLETMRTFGILYDRDDAGGELFHLYTGMLGHRLFLEVVQRVGGYDGYGERNAPVRAAAQLATVDSAADGSWPDGC
jgi:4-hydroxyphenylpyruvate dioxygenase